MKTAFRFLLSLALLLCLCSAACALEITGTSDAGQGYTTITWSAPASNGPYAVYSMMNITGQFNTDLETTTGLWPMATDVKGNSVTVGQLIPDRTSWIVVFDADNNYSVWEYQPRYDTFGEFSTDVSIQLKTQKNNAFHEVSSFSAADIEKNLGSKSYGAYIRLNYSRLAKARTYSCMVTITDPAGEALVTTLGDMELSSGHTYTYWNFYSMDGYFQALIDYIGRIAPGSYTWTLYYDGMQVTSQQFLITE